MSPAAKLGPSAEKPRPPAAKLQPLAASTASLILDKWKGDSTDGVPPPIYSVSGDTDAMISGFLDDASFSMAAQNESMLPGNDATVSE